MAYVISDECVSCGTCAAECPAEAISEGAEHFEIDADACLDCGTCADACPTEAIHPAELFHSQQKCCGICRSFFLFFFIFSLRHPDVFFFPFFRMQPQLRALPSAASVLQNQATGTVPRLHSENVIPARSIAQGSSEIPGFFHYCAFLL